SITVNGSNQSVNVFQTDPAWTNQTFYFRAGCYCQDNSGPSTEGSVVAFYQLSALHIQSAIRGPVVMLTNWAIDAAGNLTFSLLGEDRGNYFVRTSADLTNWSYLLITNSVSGWVDSTVTVTP